MNAPGTYVCGRRAALLGAVATGVGAMFVPAFGAGSDPWPGIREATFGDRRIVVDESRIKLEAPDRAEDAAIMPLRIVIPAEHARQARAVTIVIDQNPMPIAAALTFGPAAGEGERVIATRVRVDMYSDVRAVLETDDGKLYMAAHFVKASGGCSAPAQKDADQALAGLGQLRVKTFAPKSPQSSMAEAQLMIRHPNYTGLQMDQVTRLYTPAHFVDEIVVRRGKDLVFRMTGGISISENPNIRFTYAAVSGVPLFVTARDTQGARFTGSSATGL